MTSEQVITAIATLLVLILGLVFSIKFYRKRKKISEMEKNPPKEILEEFEYAESRMKGGINKDGTITNPHKILWEIAKRRQYGEEITGTGRTESTISNTELHTESKRQKDVQFGTDKNSNRDKTGIRRNKQKHRVSNFLSRIRRARRE